MPKRGEFSGPIYTDEVLGVERDSSYEDDFSDISEDYDEEEDIEMSFPDEFMF